MTTLSSFKNSLPVIYVDWSMRRGVLILLGDTDEYRIYPSLLYMLDDLKEPHLIVLEATFDSFNLAARREFIARADREGHQLGTLPTRETTKWRYRSGFGEKPSSQTYETDRQDAISLRNEAKSGAHLKKPGTPDEEWIKLRRAANHEIMEARSTGIMKKRPRSEGYAFVSNQELIGKELLEYLPDFSGQPEMRKIALGDSAGKTYNLTILVTAAIAAKHAPSTRTYDRLLGTYAHAYKSQLRSNVMFWGWTGGGKRQKLNPETRKRDDITLSDYRRELRWLYHQLRQVPDLAQIVSMQASPDRKAALRPLML